MSKIRVWRNETKATYFGRPTAISVLKVGKDAAISTTLAPAQSPGGRPIALSPGDEYHDDRGVLELALNANDGQYTVLVFGKKEDVEHDLAELGRERIMGHEKLQVPEVHVKDKDGKPYVAMGYVLRGLRGVIKDVTSEYQAGINLSGNRLAAAKELEALTTAVEEKDAIISALKAELEKAKKGANKEEKKQSAVAAAISSVTAAVKG